MGCYRPHKRTPTDQLSDISSSHNSPYRETLDSFEFDSPLRNPGLADSLELDKIRLDDGDFAPPENSSFPRYGSPAPHVLPQQPGEPPKGVTENIHIAARDPGVLDSYWHQGVPTSASDALVVQDQRRTAPILEARRRRRQKHVSSDTATLRHTPADIASPVVRERELKRWDGGSEQTHEDTTLETLESAGKFTGTGWDQFAVNEQNFGVRTTYNEDDYTTPIKRNDPGYRDRAAKAERMAWGIENAAPAKTAKARGSAVDAGKVAIFAADLGSTLREEILSNERVGDKELGEVREVVAQISMVLVSLQRVQMLQMYGSAKGIGSEKLLEDLGAVLNSCFGVLCEFDTCFKFSFWNHQPLWFDVVNLGRLGEMVRGHHKALDLIVSVMEIVQGHREEFVLQNVRL